MHTATVRPAVNGGPNTRCAGKPRERDWNPVADPHHLPGLIACGDAAPLGLREVIPDLFLCASFGSYDRHEAQAGGRSLAGSRVVEIKAVAGPNGLGRAAANWRTVVAPTVVSRESALVG